MVRLKKIAIVVLLLTIVALAVGWIVLRILPETDLVRDAVQDRLRTITGRNVNLGALHVDFAFPALVRFTLEGISVPTEDGKPLLVADRLAFSPALSSLLRREVSIESITIEGFKVSLHKPVQRGVSDALPRQSVHAGPAGEAERLTQTPPPPKSEAQPVREPLPESKKSPLTWSVHSIRLVKGRVDWIDRSVVPGEELIVSVSEIDGSLALQGSGPGFSVSMRARLGNHQEKGSPVSLSGTLVPLQDCSGLDSADLNLRCDSVNLTPFSVYVPPHVRLIEEFRQANIRAELRWQKGALPLLSTKTELMTGPNGGPRLNVQADAVLSGDFSSVLKVALSADSDNLPLVFVKRHVPPELPLDPEKGTLKVGLKGEWSQDGTWSLQGSVGGENIALTGKLKSIARTVKVWAQVKLNPEAATVESLEILGPTRLASISGVVKHPFSESWMLDLTGEVNLEPRWLKDLRVDIPSGLVLKGAVPVHGRIRGRAGDFWLDVTGNLASTDIQWVPYGEKASGKKGTISVKGKFLGKHGTADGTDATVRIGLAGVRMRLSDKGPWLTDVGLDVTSEVLFRGGRASLKEANLVVRKHPSSGSLASVRAHGTDLGLPSFRIDGKAVINFDRLILALAGLDQASGPAIAGSAPLTAEFDGSPSELNWALKLPLTHLDVTWEKAFRKPGGITGDIVARGKWSHGELVLNNGKLTLPGVTVAVQGKLRDEKGAFRGLTIALKRSELKDLAKFFPPASDLGLSGPVEGEARLRPGNQGVVPTGSLTLVAMDYRPRGADWGLEDLKGTLTFDGPSVEMPDMSGKIHGVVDAPFTIRGSLSGLTSLDTLNGKMSLDVKRGTIKADRLKALLNQTQLLLGTLINPGREQKRIERLGFESVTGTFQIHAGTARTENLKLKGQDLNLGAIGDLRLASMSLDALAGLQTYAIPTSAIGKIPMVRDFVKKHEDILKRTGLDKELKRLGIGESEAPETQEGAPQPSRAPVVVIVKLRGPASAPQVSPVLETTLNPATVSRLKSLLN